MEYAKTRRWLRCFRLKQASRTTEPARQVRTTSLAFLDIFAFYQLLAQGCGLKMHQWAFSGGKQRI